MNILAVDDEQGALNVLTKAILKAVPQADVHSFSEPYGALEFAASTTCEAAFLDIEMMGMDGISLAKMLKEKTPKINIIFVTGYSQYTDKAFSLHVSGYVYKPVTAADITVEMENLRHPILWNNTGIFARTFGNFDLMADGKAISFRRSKAKEALAYLIDRRGCSVTRRELASVLFEDQEYSRESQNYLSKILKELYATLSEIGASHILTHGLNSYSVNTQELRCDLYEYESENASAEQLNRFKGEYMSQYSWAECSLAKLLWKSGISSDAEG